MTVLSPFTLSSHRERYATKGGRAYKNMRYLGAIISFSFIVTTASAARTRLTWVNGIGYSLDHMKKGQKEISKMFGGKQVEYYHNPTAKKHDDDLVGYLGDLSQAGSQKLGRITEEVDGLVKHLKEAVASVGKKGKVIHIAHSQGALVTSLATRQLSPVEMSQIEVVAFGGAAALQKTAVTPFARCVNYYSANDPLLLLVPSAVQALRSGFVTNEEFCFLAPREGDPIADHGLLGLTYGAALEWEGQRFRRIYMSMVERSCRISLLWTLSLIITAPENIKNVWKVLLRPLVLLWMLLDRFIAQYVWNAFRSKVLPPLLLLLVAILDWIHLVTKIIKGDEGYLPVDTIARQAGQPGKI